MTLITSISGIRGTIGGQTGSGLTPLDIVKFTSSYARWLKQVTNKQKPIVVLGRDARVSGPMVEKIVAGTLMGMGLDVISLGLASTPTVEIAVRMENADGGIILTASHNPAEWNALKLLNWNGEFLSAEEGADILRFAEDAVFDHPDYAAIGRYTQAVDYNRRHIEQVLALRLVDPDKIRKAGFKVAVDCVNSVGGVILPELLRELGVDEILEVNTNPDGIFSHNPEPIPEHLTEISSLIKKEGADVGFVVDPDVDRLAIINEDGSMFGEEYTLVAVADYVLSKTPGNTASNLSSTRALRDVTEKFGYQYFASPVGEVNVVKAMKENHCIIGGEGNGGVIYPESHYGRDALVGIGLFLTHLAESGESCSGLRKRYPDYAISKNKNSLHEGINVEELLSKIMKHYESFSVNDVDGVKVDFPEGWVHLRKSNTEPIIRVYAEHRTMEEAGKLVKEVMNEIAKIIGS